MITFDQAQAQGLRLIGLADWRERAGQLLHDLRAAAESEQHASEMISRWLRGGEPWTPTTPEIRQLAREATYEESPAHWTCNRCHATGFERFYELHVWAGERSTAQRITREQFDEIRASVQNLIGVQMAIEAFAFCNGCELGRRSRAAYLVRQQEERMKRRRGETKRKKSETEEGDDV